VKRNDGTKKTKQVKVAESGSRVQVGTARILETTADFRETQDDEDDGYISFEHTAYRAIFPVIAK